MHRSNTWTIKFAQMQSDVTSTFQQCIFNHFAFDTQKQVKVFHVLKLLN